METPKEKGELIDKYLNYFEGLEILSLKSYAETAKVSGSLYLAVNKLLDEYAESKTAQLQADKAELVSYLEHVLFYVFWNGGNLNLKDKEKIESLIQKNKQ